MLRIFSSAYWPSVYFIYLFLSDYFLCVCVFEPVQIIYYVPLPFLQMVTQSCLILYDPMDCSMPGFPVLHYVPEFAQTHIHWVSDATQSSHPLLPPSPPALSFPTSGSFPMSQLFASGGQRIGASASASVLPMNIQSWFSLGLTGLISMLSKGHSRVFSNTTVQKHQFTCFSLYMKLKVKVPQSCPTLWDPMDYTVHGILQARILEGVAFPFSRGSSQLRDRTRVSSIAGRYFTLWANQGSPSLYILRNLSFVDLFFHCISSILNYWILQGFLSWFSYLKIVLSPHFSF